MIKKTLFTCLAVSFFSLSLKSQTVEYFEIKINKHISPTSTYKALKETDLISSVEALPELMDMATSDSLVYLGKSYFEYYVQKQECEVGSIEFDEVITSLTINGKLITDKSTPSVINRIIPGSCSSMHVMNMYQDGKYDTCSAPITAKGKRTDGQLIFFFRDSTIKRIDFWEAG